MIAFERTDEQRLMVEAVARFATQSLRPRQREFERLRAVPDDVLRDTHALGVPLAAFPTAVGGAGLGTVTLLLLEEELAYGDPAVPFSLAGPGAYGWAALLFGGPDTAARLIAPFLDSPSRFGAVAWGEPSAPAGRLGLSVAAERTGGGWTLRGTKAFVMNADRAADLVVFAQIDAERGWDGIGAFVLGSSSKGVRIAARHETLGLDAASFGGIDLDGVQLPEDSLLSHGGDAKRVVAFFATQALVVAARCVGLSRAALDATITYCEQRKAFGKPIGHFQAIAFTLADRAMEVEAARSMVWRAAWLWDEVARGAEDADERSALLHTAWAVSYAKEGAMRTADDAVQLHGGAGFMRDYPVEKWMRDAKQMQLCALTAEQADQIAASIAADRPVDPAWVLPGADGQNVFL